MIWFNRNLSTSEIKRRVVSYFRRQWPEAVVKDRPQNSSTEFDLLIYRTPADVGANNLNGLGGGAELIDLQTALGMLDMKDGRELDALVSRGEVRCYRSRREPQFLRNDICMLKAENVVHAYMVQGYLEVKFPRMNDHSRKCEEELEELMK